VPGGPLLAKNKVNDEKKEGQVQNENSIQKAKSTCLICKDLKIKKSLLNTLR
jgi:hypothetical protein